MSLPAGVNLYSRSHLNLHAIVFRLLEDNLTFLIGHLIDNGIILELQLCLILNCSIKYCDNFDFDFPSSPQ